MFPACNFASSIANLCSICFDILQDSILIPCPLTIFVGNQWHRIETISDGSESNDDDDTNLDLVTYHYYLILLILVIFLIFLV